jgi:hypothetical protein
MKFAGITLVILPMIVIVFILGYSLGFAYTEAIYWIPVEVIGILLVFSCFGGVLIVIAEADYKYKSWKLMLVLLFLLCFVAAINGGSKDAQEFNSKVARAKAEANAKIEIKRQIEPLFEKQNRGN